MSTSLAGIALRSLECHVRHAPCAHPGSRKACREARATGAPSTARRAPVDATRMGDPPARLLPTVPVRSPSRSISTRTMRSSSTATAGALRVPLTPNRPVGQVTRDVLDAVRQLVGPVAFDPTPQETPWKTPLDEDDEHATYDAARVGDYFAAATQAGLVLAALRAPYRGTSTPVNAWWGTFDLAISLFSGQQVEPPSSGFIARNSANAQQIEIGWWPGDHRYPRPAFFAFAYPTAKGAEQGEGAPRLIALGHRTSASTSSTGMTPERRWTRYRSRSSSGGWSSATRARCASGHRRSPKAPPVDSTGRGSRPGHRRHRAVTLASRVASLKVSVLNHGMARVRSQLGGLPFGSLNVKLRAHHMEFEGDSHRITDGLT